MKYEIKAAGHYRKDVKLAVRRGLDIEKLLDVVEYLRNGEPLPVQYHTPPLAG